MYYEIFEGAITDYNTFQCIESLGNLYSNANHKGIISHEDPVRANAFNSDVFKLNNQFHVTLKYEKKIHTN